MNRNPRFHRPLRPFAVVALAAFVAAPSLLSFEPNEWRQTQVLDVSSPGLTRVSLPAATLDAAQPGLEDLRLVDQTGNQVPYLIERPAPEAESTVRPTEFRSSIENGATRLILKTGTSAPIAGVTLETPATQFVKGVDVEGSHPSFTETDKEEISAYFFGRPPPEIGIQIAHSQDSDRREHERAPDYVNEQGSRFWMFHFSD